MADYRFQIPDVLVKAEDRTREVQNADLKPQVRENNFLDPEVRAACWACKQKRFWRRPSDGAWVCAVCHPPLPHCAVIDFSLKEEKKTAATPSAKC